MVDFSSRLPGVHRDEHRTGEPCAEHAGGHAGTARQLHGDGLARGDAGFDQLRRDVLGHMGELGLRELGVDGADERVVVGGRMIEEEPRQAV